MIPYREAEVVYCKTLSNKGHVITSVICTLVWSDVLCQRNTFNKHSAFLNCFLI